MANEYKLQDWIDQYIRGELAGEALDKFKVKLREDKEFAKKVELQKILIQEIQAERKRELKEYISENAKVEYIQNIWGKKWMYASAAIITITIGLYFALQRFELNKQMANKEESIVNDSNEIVKNDSDNKKTEFDSLKFVNIPDSISFDSNELAIAENQVPPQILVEELDIEDETVEDVTVLRNLGADEKKIASNNKEIVEKDSMLSFKSYAINEIATRTDKIRDVAVNKDADQIETVSTTEKKKKRGRLFNKDKNNETGKGDSDLNNKAETESNAELFERKVNGNVKVEYWKSVVKFVGYKYNGQALMLYGISNKATLSFIRYNGVLYMNNNGVFYSIVANNQYNKYKKVSDTQLIEILSK